MSVLSVVIVSVVMECFYWAMVLSDYKINKLKGGQYRRESPPLLVNTYVEKQQRSHFLLKIRDPSTLLASLLV